MVVRWIFSRPAGMCVTHIFNSSMRNYTHGMSSSSTSAVHSQQLVACSLSSCVYVEVWLVHQSCMLQQQLLQAHLCQPSAMGDHKDDLFMDLSGPWDEVAPPSDLMSFANLVAGMTHITPENVERAAAALLGQAGPPQADEGASGGSSSVTLDAVAGSASRKRAACASGSGESEAPGAETGTIPLADSPWKEEWGYACSSR